jgi:hypothetical protein
MQPKASSQHDPLEALFHQVHMAVATQPSPLQLAGAHERWQSSDDRQWDCHFVFRNGRFYKDLVPGVIQIANAIGLSQHLPQDLPAGLAALFAYRNKMFHHGLEWPMQQRLAFQRQIEAWPAHWFEKLRAITNLGSSISRRAFLTNSSPSLI